MKAFEYAAPASLREAVALLAAQGDRARPLAGGTDLLVQLRAGRHQLDTVVDVKRVPELNELTFDSTNGLAIGAAVPCYRIYENQDICVAYPGLIGAASTIVGTIGGGSCEFEVLHVALDVIDTGLPRRVRVDLTAEVAPQAGGVCGGTMDVLVEPLLPEAASG